jgi:hypothetical protein
MKITVHAAQRFLERVMNKTEFGYQEILFTLQYLEKLFSDVVPTGTPKYIVVPCFEKYKAIYRDNTIVTIIPKGDYRV